MSNKASKSEKKLQEEHKWYDKITGSLTKERKFDRSWQTEELLKRTKYNWFVRLNKQQIMESDNNISNFLVISLNQ